MNYNDGNFISNVTLGLKTALLEAELEINRLKDKLKRVEREALQWYSKCGKVELVFMKKITDLNDRKSKLQQKLKEVKNELDEQKRLIADKENDNVNLQFKVKELKSLLDIKVELLESLNIKGDKYDKNTFTNYRTDYKNLMKNLKLILKNSQCYPESHVLEDIQKCVLRTEKGKNVDVSKYLRRIKNEKKDTDNEISIKCELTLEAEKNDVDNEILLEQPIVLPEPVHNDNINIEIKNFEPHTFVSNSVIIENVEPIAENTFECEILSESDDEECSSQKEIQESVETSDLVQQIVPVTKECDKINFNSNCNMPNIALGEKTEPDLGKKKEENKTDVLKREEKETEFDNDIMDEILSLDRLAKNLNVEEVLSQMRKLKKICSEINVLREFYEQNEIELNDCFKKPAPKKFPECIGAGNKKMEASSKIFNRADVFSSVNANSTPKELPNLGQGDSISDVPNFSIAVKKNVEEILKEMIDLHDTTSKKRCCLEEFLKKKDPISAEPKDKKNPDYDCLVLLELMSTSEEETMSDEAVEIKSDHNGFKNDSEKKSLESDSNDESEEEKLVIAETDHDDRTSGIEINKFDDYKEEIVKQRPFGRLSVPFNSSMYSPLSNSFIGKNGVVESHSSKVSNQIEIENETKHDGKLNNNVQFKFYIEQEVKPVERLLTPFEEVWEILQNIRLPKLKTVDDELIVCCRAVPHMACFMRKPLVFPEKPINPNAVKKVKQSLETFTKEIVRNEMEALANFRMRLISQSTDAVASGMVMMVMNYAKCEMFEMKRHLERLVNLVFELEKDFPELFFVLLNSLKNKMFTKLWRLDKNASMVECIITLSIFYTMINVRRKNFKPLKDLIYESLCCQKNRAYPIAFGVLSVYPAIFNDYAKNSILTQITLFSLIHHTMDWNLDMYKIVQVREIVRNVYYMTLGEKAAEDHAKEAMFRIDDETWEEAIFLLCKRQQFAWSYTNVVMKYLIQIVQKWKSQDFDEVVMIKTVQALSKIVKCCPNKGVHGRNELSKDVLDEKRKKNYPNYNVDSIINSLANVLGNPKSSRELLEIVAVTICNISHLNFELCSQILSSWKPPNDTISSRCLQKLNACIYEGYAKSSWLQLYVPSKRPRKFKEGQKKVKNTIDTYGTEEEYIEVGIRKKDKVKKNVSEGSKKKKKRKNKNKKTSKNEM